MKKFKLVIKTQQKIKVPVNINLNQDLIFSDPPNLTSSVNSSHSHGHERQGSVSGSLIDIDIGGSTNPHNPYQPSSNSHHSSPGNQQHSTSQGKGSNSLFDMGIDFTTTTSSTPQSFNPMNNINVTSKYPIDNIPSSLNEEQQKERIDAIIKVIIKLLLRNGPSAFMKERT